MEDRLENRKPIEVALPGSDAPPIVFRPIVLPGEVAEFRMGSREGEANEQPVHTVRLTEPYYMAETPVTQAQFAAFKNDHEDHIASADHPVDQVEWLEAMAFCRWLTQPEGYGIVHLPTEAQWEYACRCSRLDAHGKPVIAETQFWNGDGAAALAEIGWFGEDFDTGGTHPVKSKQLDGNGFGLYDLHGNVFEWCRDDWPANIFENPRSYERLAHHVRNPSVFYTRAKFVETYRALRGGSWGRTANECSSGYRFGAWACTSNTFIGFRICLLLGMESGYLKEDKKAERSHQSQPGAAAGGDVAGEESAP